MTSSETLVITLDGGMAILTLNRPAVLNAIDVAAAKALLSAIDQIEKRGDIRAILLRGEGRGFCAGGDVSTFTGAEPHATVADRTMAVFHEAVLRLARSPIPSVAAVHGAVAGAGIGLMLACDFVLAAESARFSLAYTKIGASIDGGASWFLPRLVGSRKAKELVLLSERIDAAEAARLGIVNRVVATDDLAAEAVQLARRLVDGPTAAFGEIKKLVDTAFGNDLHTHLAHERQVFVEVAKTGDFAEGLTSFFEKRAPVFRGR